MPHYLYKEHIPSVCAQIMSFWGYSYLTFLALNLQIILVLFTYSYLGYLSRPERVSITFLSCMFYPQGNHKFLSNHLPFSLQGLDLYLRLLFLVKCLTYEAENANVVYNITPSQPERISLFSFLTKDRYFILFKETPLLLHKSRGDS